MNYSYPISAFTNPQQPSSSLYRVLPMPAPIQRTTSGEPLPNFTHLLQQIKTQDTTATTTIDDDAQLAIARQQVESLFTVLRNTQSARKLEQEQFVQLNAEHAQLTNYANQLTSKVQHLEKNLTESQANTKSSQLSLNEKKQALQQKQLELNLTRNDLFNLNQTLGELQTRLSRSDSALQFNLQRCANLEFQCDQLHMRIVELENQLVESRQANQSITASMHTTWQEKGMMQSNLSQTNQKLARAAENHQYQQETIRQLQVTILSLQGENQSLKTKLETVGKITSTAKGVLEKKKEK